MRELLGFVSEFGGKGGEEFGKNGMSQ